MTKPLVFDLKQHLREWQRHVLPIFVIVGSIGLVLFALLRASLSGPRLPEEGIVPARIGLIAPVPGKAETFDPALAALSPRELVLAPTAAVFDAPFAKGRRAFSNSLEVAAVADGYVLHADEVAEAGKKTLVLLHDRPDTGPVEAIYRGLGTLRVPVGTLVRRGQVIGTAERGDDPFPIELRQAAALDFVDAPHGATSSLSAEETLRAWRGRPDDRLSPAPEGEPLEPASLQLETVPPPGAPLP